MPLPAGTPPLAALDLFVSVVEQGSVSRAAALHGVSQPTASARLSHLERRLGMRLLDRTPGGSRPTPQGALVADWARDVLRAAHRLDAGVRALGGDAATQLHLAASYTIAEYLLPGWLARFRAAHPQSTTRLEVANSERVADQVLAGAADLGFVEGPELAAGVSAVTVGSDVLVVVVAPGHPWASSPSGVSPSELAAAPLILREPGSGTRESFERAMEPHRVGPPPEPLLELGSTSALKAAVAAGTGPGVLSALAVTVEFASGTLVHVPVPGVSMRRRLRAIWQARAEPEGAAAALLAAIRDEAVRVPSPTATLDL